MRAAVFPAPGVCEVVERELPSLTEGDILVRVEACGVCGTDLHIFRGEFPARFPLVAGHEFAGVVEETGAGVARVRAGDRVAVDPNISCGACPACQKGLLHLCRDLSAIGVTMAGGFATHCIVPARQAHRLPDDLPFPVAAMSEPVACCVHGIDQADLRSGDTVVIIGAGMIGLVMVQLALSHGAAVVIVSEPSSAKRDLAKALGATITADPATDHLPQKVAEATDGSGADVVIECVGGEGTAQQAVGLAGEGGRVLFFGVAPEPARVAISPYEIYRKELTITGSFTNPSTQGRALALLRSGRVHVEGLISHRFPLEQLPTALHLMAAGQAIKILIEPQS